MTPLLLLALASGPELEPFEVEGKFAAAFPGPRTAVKSEVKDYKTEHGVLSTANFTAPANKRLMLAISYTDYPDGFLQTPSDDFLKAARNGIKTRDVKIETEKKLTADDVNPDGLEVDYDLGKYRAKVRLYKHKARLFVVSASGSEDEVASDTVKKFMASFRVK
jgi:hypothetical protein